MSFKKKIVILSSVGNAAEKGILTIEKSISGLKGSVVLYGMTDLQDGEYDLRLKSDQNPIQRVRLGKSGKINRTFPIDPKFNIDGRLCALISCSDSKPILYGANFNQKLWQSGLMESISRTEEKPRELTLKPTRPVTSDLKTIDLGDLASVLEPVRNFEYDDTAIAAVNYYSLMDDEAQNTAVYMPNEVRTKEAFKAEKEITEKDSTISNQGADVVNWDSYNRLSKKQSQSEYHAPKFYTEKYSELRRLFDNYPEEETLTKNLSGTVWVRVDYSENQYYVIGLIGENPDYIAYGIPGKYSINPPQELLAYCSWLPLVEKDYYGEGYWMMYQDAETGESVKYRFNDRKS